MTHSIYSETINSDREVAEQLEKLSEKIQEGIDKAYQLVRQAEQIKQEIELQKSEFNPTVEKVMSVSEQIQHWEEVLNKIAEIADKETVQRLEQQIESASNQINQVQSQVKHTDIIFDGFMSELQMRLVEVSKLKVQVEADKIIVENLAMQTDNKYQQVLEMFSQISNKQKSSEGINDLTGSLLQTDDTEEIIKDLYSELDFHVDLDRKHIG
jgi:chromosome segregation ATPase